MTALTITDPKFNAAVRTHVESLERSITTLDSNGVHEVARKTDTLLKYARDIKADTSTINQLMYGKLLACAQFGKLNPATPRSQTGRGKKKTVPGTRNIFFKRTPSPPTASWRSIWPMERSRSTTHKHSSATRRGTTRR